MGKRLRLYVLGSRANDSFLFILKLTYNRLYCFFNIYHSLRKISRWQMDSILFLCFPENWIWHFMQIVSIRDSLHVISNPVSRQYIYIYILRKRFPATLILPINRYVRSFYSYSLDSLLRYMTLCLFQWKIYRIWKMIIYVFKKNISLLGVSRKRFRNIYIYIYIYIYIGYIYIYFKMSSADNFTQST